MYFHDAARAVALSWGAQCKKSFELDEALPTFDEVRRWLEPGEGKLLNGPTGCADCRMQGYSGRTGVFEVMVVTRGIRHMVLDKQPTEVLRQKAVDEGMVEFRQAALLKVARGETSIEEVFRVFNENITHVKRLIERLVAILPMERNCACATEAQKAVVGTADGGVETADERR